MDPITHGVLGASVAYGIGRRREIVVGGLAGAAGAMAADLDVLVRSASDPLLLLEFHRQFTHSIMFIPIGGLIVSSILWLLLRRWKIRFSRLYLFATVAYATHPILDACTSYGTLLLWPFSDKRVAWDNIAIVDPVVTLPLLAAVILGMIKKQRRWAIAACIWVAAYLLFGVVQRERAEAVAENTASQRGHDLVRLDAKPNLGNLFVWRTIYEANGRFYVDAVRLGIFGDNRSFPGRSAEKIEVGSTFPALPHDSVQYRDLLRFAWFADGWLAVHPAMPNVACDLRYGKLPNSVEPLWAIRVDPQRPNEHVKYQPDMGIESDIGRALLFGLE